MKVPCTECKQQCRRKLVTRGLENLNRIYYKCEACKFKVGWEDELLAGAAPWTKQQVQQQHQLEQQQQQTKQQAIPTPQPAPLASQQPAQNLTTVASAAPLRPTASKITPSPVDSEVEIICERPAQPPPSHKYVPTATTTTKDGPSPDAPNDSYPQQQTKDAANPGQNAATTHRFPAANTRSQKRQTDALVQLPQSQAIAAGGASTRRPKQPAGAAPAAVEGGEAGSGATASTTSVRVDSIPQPNTAPGPAPKRKFDEAFVDLSERPPKRPVQVPVGDTAGGADAPSAADPAATPSEAGGSGVLTALQSPVAGTAQPSSVNVSKPAVPDPAVVAPSAASEGVFVSRGIRVHPIPRQANGCPTVTVTVGTPATAPPPAAAAQPAAAASFVPGRGNASSEMEEVQLQIRSLRRDLAVATARAREEQSRAQHEVEAAQRLRLRQEPLERELRELRIRYTDSLAREKQLIEQLNIYKARDRLQQQQAATVAQQAVTQQQQQAVTQQQQAQQQQQHQQRLAAERAERLAAAQQQRAHQAAAASAAAAAAVRAQAHAQAHAEFAKQYGFWGFKTFQAHAIPQPEYDPAWHAAGGAGAANGQPRAATGVGRDSEGGGLGTADGQSVPNGRGTGGSGGGGSGGGGGTGQQQQPQQQPQQQQQQQQKQQQKQQPQPQQQQQQQQQPQQQQKQQQQPQPQPQQQQQPQVAPPAVEQPPRDETALLAFASSLPPAFDEITPVRTLKQFLSEAGAEAAARLCSEKTELLALARERLNAWEIRRSVACNRLANPAQGDRALFRLEPSGPLPSKAALQKAFRELLLRLHPDKNPSDELATQAVQYLNEAYKRLMAVAA